ncbi:MAG: PaaI family thioesterase [Promethearchaeota archaeon]
MNDEFLKRGYKQVFRDYPKDGFEHYCFGCSKANPISMGLTFYGKPGEKEVASIYEVRKEYCGFPAFTHGGIVAVLLDEVLAYATYHVMGKFGITKSLNINYKRPVLIGKKIFIKGEVINIEKSDKKATIHAKGAIFEGTSDKGKICAEATSILVILPPEKFKKTYMIST